MAATISVPFEIIADTGVKEGYDPDSGAFAEVKFRCAWNDRLQLCKDLVGTSFSVNPNSGGITTIFPFAYPGSPNLYGRRIISVEPFGEPYIAQWLPLGKWLVRKQADVTCRFEYPYYTSGGNQDASGRPYTTTRIQLSGQVVTLPNTAFRFTDGTYNAEKVGIPFPQMQLQLTRYMLPYIPLLEMITVLGGVNGGPLQIGNITLGIGTTMFCGGGSEITLNTDGSVLQTVDYQFLFRPIPWGWALHPQSGLWAPLVNSAGNPPVNYVDFSILP